MCLIFFFNFTSSSQIYTLSLHDALPIYCIFHGCHLQDVNAILVLEQPAAAFRNIDCVKDRKSTRLNSSHEWISYAVFCLKKKNTSLKLDMQRMQQTSAELAIIAISAPGA